MSYIYFDNLNFFTPIPGEPSLTVASTALANYCEWDNTALYQVDFTPVATTGSADYCTWDNTDLYAFDATP